ncbi:protein of unknown function [Burkholderia multivorans]
MPAVAHGERAANRASGRGEQRRGGAPRGGGSGRGSDRRRPRGRALRPAGRVRADPGRSAQSHPFRDRRQAARGAERLRSDLADRLGEERAGRGVQAARTARATRRVDDALRVAPGAGRDVGVLLLHRYRRASGRCGGCGRARGAGPEGRVPEGSRLVSTRALTLREGRGVARAVGWARPPGLREAGARVAPGSARQAGRRCRGRVREVSGARRATGRRPGTRDWDFPRGAAWRRPA